MIQFVFGVKYFYLTLIDSIIYLYPIKHCNTMIQYNTSCFLPAFLPVVKYFYLTHVKHSNQIKHSILYYHITAFGGIRDSQGFSAPRGYIPFFAVLPDQRRSPSSSSEAIIPKFTSPIPPLPSFSPLPHLPQFFHRPASFGIPTPSPHHPLTVLSLHPLFLNTSPYLPPPSPIPPTSLISSFNSLYFAYFLPASLPPHAIKPNPRFIFGPFDIIVAPQ